MGQSYVRHGTNVVCTNMTCGTPREIWRVDKDGNVINTASKLPLLNIDDKKISDTFVCKMPIKKWGGAVNISCWRCSWSFDSRCCCCNWWCWCCLTICCSYRRLDGGCSNSCWNFSSHLCRL